MPEVLDARMPALLPATSYLIGALTDPDISLQRLPPILEAVPSIAARLVGLANSAWSSPTTPVTSLQLACTRLGLDLVRTVSIALAAAEPFTVRNCAAFRPHRFWRSSLVAADAGSLLTQGHPPDAAATVRTVALLSRLGILWLAEHDPVRLAGGLKELEADPAASLQAWLSDNGGWGHVEVSIMLARHWQFPAPMVAAFEAQVGPATGDSVGATVARALSLCRHLTRGGGSQAPAASEAGGPPIQPDAMAQLRQSLAEKSELAKSLAGPA